MTTSDVQRQQKIDDLLMQQCETAEAAVFLWERIAVEIISLVGEGGFNALYTRSIFLCQSAFPWLAPGVWPAQPEYRFAELKASLEAQAPEQANAANRLLLITFIDILATLIGEKLTEHILSSVLDHGAGPHL